MNENAIAILLILSLPFAAGCGESEEVAETPIETTTIRPATPPEADTDDVVLTQTTEIGEERSPNEGGVLTDEDHVPPDERSPE
ncbi:MAG TPA: hypothetical protein VM534_06785 [Thermoanaerobaculia bacterium]|nr:hypothetical protein [Thermoanaerobaculia bacterium]